MKSLVKSINFFLYGKFRYIFKFGIVGVLNTLIDFLVFTTCHSLFNLSYTSSQILGYSFGVINSFIFNRKWTFQDKKTNKKISNELLQFMIVNIVSLLITIIAINFLAKNMNLNVYLAKVIVTILAQLSNYFGYKLWVFNKN